MLLLCFVMAGLPAGADETTLPAFPGAKSDWNGFEKHDFEVDGRSDLAFGIGGRHRSV